MYKTIAELTPFYDIWGSCHWRTIKKSKWFIICWFSAIVHCDIHPYGSAIIVKTQTTKPGKPVAKQGIIMDVPTKSRKAVKVGTQPFGCVVFRYDYALTEGQKIEFREDIDGSKYQRAVVIEHNENAIFIDLI